MDEDKESLKHYSENEIKRGLRVVLYPSIKRELKKALDLIWWIVWPLLERAFYSSIMISSVLFLLWVAYWFAELLA